MIGNSTHRCDSYVYHESLSAFNKQNPNRGLKDGLSQSRYRQKRTPYCCMEFCVQQENKRKRQ
eukprot:2021262-Pleurochrysis_carterae.AAC.1